MRLFPFFHTVNVLLTYFPTYVTFHIFYNEVHALILCFFVAYAHT